MLTWAHKLSPSLTQEEEVHDITEESTTEPPCKVQTLTHPDEAHGGDDQGGSDEAQAQEPRPIPV